MRVPGAQEPVSGCKPAIIARMRILPRTLRGRMSWAFLAPAVVSFAALITLAYFAARATLEDEVGERLAGTAAAAAALLPSGLVARFRPGNERTHANLAARLRRVVEATGVRRAFLVTLDGRSLVDTAPDAPPPGEPDRDLAQDRFELEQVARGERAASVLYEARDGRRYKRGFAPLFHDGAVVAVVGVEGSAAGYAGLDALRSYMLALGGLALAGLAGVVVVFSRALTAPLKRLAAAARRIGAGELDRPVRPARGAEEIVVLARTMEEMRDALLRRERELQMMLGGIAHEVRNPLGGMELFVGLLREDLSDRPDELALLGRVEAELGNLKRLVEEFLAYARRQPPERQPLDLAALVDEVATLVDVDLRLEPGPDAPLAADRDQLRRLLLNLVRNARQAGATTVRVRRAGTALVVEDDGPGVPSDQADRIFDAFYTTREKGTGLGLALCRRIAEDHGGRLVLENPGARGARFRVELG